MSDVKQRMQIPRTKAVLLTWQVLLLVALALALPIAVKMAGPPGMLAGLGLAAGLVMVAVHPLVPFALYFSALFFSETQLPGLPVSANQVLAILFLASCGSHFLRGHGLRLQSPLIPFLSVLAIYFTISAATGESPERGLVHMRYTIIYPVLALCLAACIRNERNFQALCWIIIVTTSGAAIMAVADALARDLSSMLSVNLQKARIRGTAKNPIVFGWSMLFAFPFAFFLWSELKTQSLRVIALLSGLGSIFVAVLTFNRQTFILIVVMLLVVAFLFTYRNRAALLTVLVLSVGVVGGGMAPLIISRLFTLSTYKTDPSFLEHRDTFLVAHEMFRRHPIFGVGLGSYPAVWKQYIPADYPTNMMQYHEATKLRYPDMGYMQLLSETGIIGFALFVVLILWIGLRAWRMRREALDAGDTFVANFGSLILSLLAFLALSTAIQDTFLYVRVWVLFGLAILLDKRVMSIRNYSATAAVAD